jgi:tetratricopeptide (TPR) repeat protein
VELYRKLIELFPDLALALHARLELAELLDERGDPASAIKILKEALDKEPQADLADRMRLRLGLCHLALGGDKAALGHFEILAGNSQSPFAAQGHALAAECLMRKENWEAAVKHLVVFRDLEPFQNIGNVSDWALLRLSDALAQSKKIDESRQVLDTLITRFSESTFRAHAHYAAGLSWSKGKDYDKAALAFGLAAANSKGDLAGRALVQQAISQIELKQFVEAGEILQKVADKPDSPDVRGLALLEAAYCAQQQNQPEQATKSLSRLISESPASSWAEEAKKRLEDAEASFKPPHDLSLAAPLLVPNVRQDLHVDRLGEAVGERVSLEDPTVGPGHAYTLARLMPARQTPAAWRHIAIPDPFENHNAVTFSLPEEVFLPLSNELSTPILPKK